MSSGPGGRADNSTELVLFCPGPEPSPEQATALIRQGNLTEAEAHCLAEALRKAFKKPSPAGLVVPPSDQAPKKRPAAGQEVVKKKKQHSAGSASGQGRSGPGQQVKKQPASRGRQVKEQHASGPVVTAGTEVPVVGAVPVTAVPWTRSESSEAFQAMYFVPRKTYAGTYQPQRPDLAETWQLRWDEYYSYVGWAQDTTALQKEFWDWRASENGSSQPPDSFPKFKSFRSNNKF